MTLSLNGISKRFGTLQANRNIDLELEPGSIHGLLGENGAGKSTLMRILSGFIPPDSGVITLDGRPVPVGSPRAATVAGIGMLHQDPLVCLPFTALENYTFGRSGDTANLRRRLIEDGDRYGFSIDPDVVTRNLSVGERQQLEILRLLSLGVRVLILDEPTSGITTGQRETLFETLRVLAREGLIVIFVSHKLEEVEQLCHEATILRAGEVVGREPLPCPADRLVELMFGTTVVEWKPDSAVAHGEALHVRGVTSQEGRLDLVDADLIIHLGEVVGVAGLEGSGQHELLRMCAGLISPTSGAIEIGERQVKGGYPAHRVAGVHYLPAGRLEEGLVPGLSIADHLLLASSGTDRADARERADLAIERFNIKGGPDDPVDSLSGGNQQRVLLAMMPEVATLIVMEHPTRGLDLESADLVWRTLLDRRAAGTAILFASADLDEILKYSDRVVVVAGGRMVSETLARDLDPDRLGHLIGGREVA